MNVDNKCNFSF